MTSSSADAAKPDAQGGDDPRPVFQGEWAKADGHARREHMEAVKAWKARNPEAAAAAQSRTATPSGQPAMPVTPGDAATRTVLTSIRDDGSAHDSDRIRAAQALIAMDREAAQQVVGTSPLVALREALELLQPEERLAWLQGERLQHLSGEGEKAARVAGTG